MLSTLLDNKELIAIGLFFLLQLVNVVLSTLRSVLTVNASPAVASVFAAISYTFYNVIVKLITSQDMMVIIVVTFITNLIGTYLGKLMYNKSQKDKLWIYTATMKTKNVDVDNIMKMLKIADIKYVYTVLEEGVMYSIQVFAPTAGHSTLIKAMFADYGIKYYVIEAKQ